MMFPCNFFLVYDDVILKRRLDFGKSFRDFIIPVINKCQ